MKEVKSKEQLTRPFKNKRLTPLQAIKHHCRYECCVNDIKSWQECSVECLLKPYRFGKNPYHKLKGLIRLKKSIENLKPFTKNEPLQVTSEPPTIEKQEQLK